MKSPIFSIVIPTFNSAGTLEKTLRSITKQNFPKSKLEILLVDGGSMDETLDIAANYKCRIIPNPKTDQVYGKHLGFLKARGRYLLNMDSDEVLESVNSLKTRLEVFKKNPEVKGIMSTGLKTPRNYPPINYYINDFGDPFSFFMYGLSQDPRFYVNQLSKIGKKVYEDKECIVLNFSEVKNMPIIELTQGGGTLDLNFAKSRFSKLRTKAPLVTLIFYLFNSNNCLVAILKKDNIVHFSSKGFMQYLKKLRSRVKNNIYKSSMGKSGYLGREEFQSREFNFKKYLFILYSLSVVLPIKDSIHLVVSRGNIIYLIHPIVCLITVFFITYYYLLNAIGIKVSTKGYGQ